MEKISLIYEEHTRLNAELQTILEGSLPEKQKLSQLRGLLDRAQTPPGKSHITYYIELLRERRKIRYKHRISLLALLIWLIYILYRTCLYAYQEADIGPSILGTSSSQALAIILLVPVLMLAYYAIRYLISLKNK